MSPREYLMVYMITPLLFLKKPKMVFYFWAWQIPEATDLNLDMHTQLDTQNNMDWVPPCRTFILLLCNTKNGALKKHLNLGY